MSLQLTVIERLFDRLIASYGNEFLNRYQGLDVNKAKSMWAYELAGYANRLDAIGWALENLPERAPNVIEFRNLCTKAPEKAAPMLDRPRADPAIVALITKKLSAPVQAVGRLDWAHRIIERKEQGAKISPTVLRMAKDALGAA